MSGTLFIVATPIGNLEDITFRAVRVLKEADLIACEDTRQTRKLLQHYSIDKPLVSYHEYNEQARAEELVAAIEGGKNVALVSDAGTPLIADPGYRIVNAARARGIAVVPVPGAAAAIAALSASGLPTDSFAFHGFLPSKSGARRKLLEALKGETATLVFYEAPHRILETLHDIELTLGGRPVVVARELTKVHEEFLQGTAAEIREALQAKSVIRGEFVIMVGKAAGEVVEHGTVQEAVGQLLAKGMSRMEAYKQVARERGISKRDVYRSCEIE